MNRFIQGALSSHSTNGNGTGGLLDKALLFLYSHYLNFALKLMVPPHIASSTTAAGY
jgi:hypothetical protein